MQFCDLGIQDILRLKKQGYKIVAWGAGNNLLFFCEMFQSFDISKKLDVVVDRNPEKQNSELSICGTTLKVMMPEMVSHRFDGRKVLVVITNRMLEQVLHCMKEENLFSEAIVCFHGFVKDCYSSEKLKNGYMDCGIVHDDNRIPKIIHYCWFGRNPLPDEYRRYIATWHRFCPDYEIVQWNEDNYDVSQNAYMQQAYEVKKWGFVPDYARLDIIYRYGGIYLDTDVEILQPLDTLLYQEAFCGYQDMSFVALGLGFGSIPKNPLIKALRDDYETKTFMYSNRKLNQTLSPIFQTEYLKKIGLRRDGTFQQLPHINVYPKVWFAPMNQYNRKVEKNRTSYLMHHWSSSWVEDEARRQWQYLPKFYQESACRDA